MSTTTTTNTCECCGLPVDDSGHFGKDRYPAGAVLCRSCFRDRLIGEAFGTEVECTRKGSPEHVDLATGVVTTLTEDGVNVTTRRERVAWCGPGPAPDWLRPALDPDDTDQEGHDDDRSETA